MNRRPRRHGDGIPATLGDVTDPLAELARDLDAIAGRYGDSEDPVTGIRAVEPEPAARRYLCVRRSGEVMCVDREGRPLEDADERHRVAAAVLLVEYVEESIDGEECRLVASLSDRITSADLDAVAIRSAEALAEAAASLADWRLDPERSIARVADLDRAAQLQSGAHVAHSTYLAATEHLVEIQDTLDGGLIEILRDLENACGRAGIAASLPAALGQAMEDIHTDATRLLRGGNRSGIQR